MQEIAQVTADVASAVKEDLRLWIDKMRNLNPDFEVGLVGAGLADCLGHTTELHVMKFKAAMKTKDREKWIKAVEDEYQRFVKAGVFKVLREKPSWAKELTSTWAMKKKANGTFRARCNARGYEQVDGQHYDEHDKSAPVISEMGFMIVLTLHAMTGWNAKVVDVKGAFLLGDWNQDRPVVMRPPEGMTHHFPEGAWLLLLKTLYGTKQAAKEFWKKLVQAMQEMDFTRSMTEPCLYFRWDDNDGLSLWTSWVDDCIAFGRNEAVEQARQKMLSTFECDDVGNLTDYVGVKIDFDRVNGVIYLTQPVIIQSLVDEFHADGGKGVVTPGAPGKVLDIKEGDTLLNSTEQTQYRSLTGKLLYLTVWTRPDIRNSVRELSKYLKQATHAHMSAAIRVVDYVVSTRFLGKKLAPYCKWDGKDQNFQFRVEGYSDSDFAKDPVTRKSVTGSVTYLCGSPIIERCHSQSTVAISVTEAELGAVTETVQDMMYVKTVLESLGLQVKTPMTLYCDNKGAIDLVNGWSIAGRTRHVANKINFLREQKEMGRIEVRYIQTQHNVSDLFTKNLSGPDFNRHVGKLMGRAPQESPKDAG